MSNQSQDNQKIDILTNLLNFLYCLVPCYTESEPKTGTKEKKRYYALVYYCNKKFKPENNNSNGNNNSNNDFVKYKFNGKDIYLHRDTVNRIGGKCQDCNFYNIVNNNNYKDFWDEIWNNLNIELIVNNSNINDKNSYETKKGDNNKISIYQIVKHDDKSVPTTVFIWKKGKLEPKKCDENLSIFIKDDAYEEDIDNQSQNQSQNQKQKDNTEKLLKLKKLLITKTTENLLKVINNVIEQQISVDENLLEKAVEIILKNIDSNIANKNTVELLKVVNNVIKQQISVDENLLEKAVEIILEKKSISPDPANDAKQIVDKLMK